MKKLSFIAIVVMILIVLSGCDKKLKTKESKLNILKENIINPLIIVRKTQVFNNDTINVKLQIDSSDLDIHIIELLPDTIAWTDEGCFYLLAFEPNKVEFIFNPSCAYWFPSKIIKNEIIFYWALNPDCVFDRGLEKKFQNIKNPKVGKPFGKIKLLTDSTLFIEYYYTDWVKKINEEEYKTIDTLFPSYFKKINLIVYH